MKKLILFFGVIAAAFSSNAAYLYWQVTDDYTSGITDYDYVSVSYTGNRSGVLATVLKEDAASPISTDLSVLSDGGTYSIFVELLNYDSANKTWSQVGVTTSGQITYCSTAANNSTYIDDGFSAGSMTSLAAWHGGTIEAPEPASAMMVMFGLSFLALRRRRV